MHTRSLTHTERLTRIHAHRSNQHIFQPLSCCSIHFVVCFLPHFAKWCLAVRRCYTVHWCNCVWRLHTAAAANNNNVVDVDDDDGGSDDNNDDCYGVIAWYAMKNQLRVAKKVHFYRQYVYRMWLCSLLMHTHYTHTSTKSIANCPHTCTHAHTNAIYARVLKSECCWHTRFVLYTCASLAMCACEWKSECSVYICELPKVIVFILERKKQWTHKNTSN